MTENMPKKGYNIAVLAAQFNPRLNYWENVCPETLAQEGHKVCVFAPLRFLDGTIGQEEEDQRRSFRVVRAKQVLKIGKTLFPFDLRVLAAIRAFQPDVAIISAPLLGPGYFWMKALRKECKRIVVFSELRQHRRGRAVSRWIKRWWAKRLLQSADIIYSVTRETTEILREWGGTGVVGRIQTGTLAVDPQAFSSRGQTPSELLKFRERFERIAVMVTRVRKGKGIERFFGEIARFLAAHPNFGFVLAGLDAGSASERLRRIVYESQVRDQVLLLPQLESHEVGDIFRMAEFSVWISVSVGIYHSLFCGCPAVLWRRVQADHIVFDGLNGIWFENWDGGAEAMNRAATVFWNREEIATSIRHAEASRVLPALLESAMRVS